MKSDSSLNFYLLKIGGWSAILSGTFFLVVTIYIFGILGAIGFDPVMFDDHTLLHPWVVQNARLYQLSWLFYYLTQFFLLPVPLVLAHYLKGNNDRQTALAQLSKTIGTASITIAILSPVIFYTISPITAKAYVAASNSAEAQALVLVMSDLMTDIPKEIRLFSEVILGAWLLICGYLFWDTNRSKSVGWLVMIVGGWTLAVVILKIFNPLTPLEDFLGLLLTFTYIPVGVHLLRIKRPQTPKS